MDDNLTIVKVAPSEFAFLYEECKRCFYRSRRLSTPRPRTPFPGVFNAIDSRMTNWVLDQNPADIDAALPAGTATKENTSVYSELIDTPDPQVKLRIGGRADVLFEFEDGTVGLPDLKCTKVADAEQAQAKATTYTPQLRAYKWALEHPGEKADGTRNPARIVSKMGLVCFDPDGVFDVDGDAASLTGKVRYVSVEADDDAFAAFVADLGALLSGPLPEPGERCGFCAWIDEVAETSEPAVQAA